MEDPVVPLERNLYGHPLAGILWERQFEKILLKHGWENIPNWECLFEHREKGLFLSVYVDDIKLAGKKHNIDPMWKVLNKEVDLGEPTSFLDHVYLGCTQRQCEVSQNIVDNYRTMFESRNSAERLEKLPFSQNTRISSWSYDMVGHAKKCVEQLARSITKWTRACDKRLNRLISYIHHTSEYKQYCHVGNSAKQCRLGLFQDSDFAGDLEDSKSTSGGTLCFFGSHTFVPISWMCKKQTSVSHSSTESEIIYMDAGLRLDGIPALDLWDLIVCVFGSVSQISDRTGQPVNDVNKHHKISKEDWTEIGWVACSGTMGSNCFCSWKYFSCFRSIGETWERCSQTSQASQENRCDERHWFCSFKCPIRASRSFIVCVWGQWSSNQDDYQR